MSSGNLSRAAALLGASTNGGDTPDVPADTPDGGKPPKAKWRIHLAWDGLWEWFFGRPKAFRLYLSWFFTDRIDFERQLQEFAIRELKASPDQLIAWENQRNLTKMRNKMGIRLFWFLAVETFVIFGIVILRGFKAHTGFDIDTTSLNVVVTGTIIQVAALVMVVVQSLFPPPDKTAKAPEMPPPAKVEEEKTDAKDEKAKDDEPKAA